MWNIPLVSSSKQAIEEKEKKCNLDFQLTNQESRLENMNPLLSISEQ